MPGRSRTVKSGADAGNVRAMAREAIARGDAMAARELLANIASGRAEGRLLESRIARALVATARADPQRVDQLAIDVFEEAQRAKREILLLIESSRWDRGDLAEIRSVLGRVDENLRDEEAVSRGLSDTRGATPRRRRLGAGHLEAKLIRGHGPYLYYRYREGGRHRSVYVGRITPSEAAP